MFESSVLQELKEEWTREATRQTLINSLMTFLVGRFGAKATKSETEIQAVDDGARLKELIEHAATCRTLASFRKKLAS